MHKIVLFIEPTDDAFFTPYKIGHLFMNRFTIEEAANFEIVKIFEIGKSSRKTAWNFEEDRTQKGMSLSTVINISLLNNLRFLNQGDAPGALICVANFFVR